MKGKELESRRLDMSFQFMKLDTVPVIDEDVFLLCYSVVRMILQETERGKKGKSMKTEHT